jgi:hypothetical protein
MSRADEIRVYALRIGSSKIPYGQFYGGAEGWIGFRGAIKFLMDKSHYITAPIHACLPDPASPRRFHVGRHWNKLAPGQ